MTTTCLRATDRQRPYYESSVSVIVSIYDRYDREAVTARVLSSWRSQTVRPELILAEQSYSAPRWVDLAAQLGASHVLSHPDSTAQGPRYDIGRVRNAGIHHASSTYLYLTDADVLPFREDYLESLIAEVHEQPDLVLFRPFMMRLMQDDVGTFLEFLASGGRPRVSCREGCLSRFENGRLEPVEEVRQCYGGWEYVCTPDDWARLSAEGFDGSQEPVLIMKPVVHWGGTFLTRQTAISVGGFAEGYHGWGYEDEDFHAKLAGCCAMVQIRERAMLHFEHPRRYNNAILRTNQLRFEERLRVGAKAMISADRIRFLRNSV